MHIDSDFEPMTLDLKTANTVNEAPHTFMNGLPCNGIDPFDRAFLYGDGFFTSILVSDGQPSLWRRHLERLTQGTNRLKLDVDLTLLEADVFNKSQLLRSGVLKVIISRGIGARGYLPPDQPATVYVQLFPQASTLQSIASQPIVSGILTGHLGQTIPQLAGLKTLNRLEQVILRQELATFGWVEALVCDGNGYIIEGVYSNCFFLVDGRWMTPPIQLSGIAGVMRAELMACMHAQKIPLLIETLHRDSLHKIEALFFCNALSKVVPVSHLDHRALDLGAVKSLTNLLF